MASPEKKMKKEINEDYMMDGETERLRDHGTFFITIIVCGYEVQAVVDSLSVLSHINKEFCDQLKTNDAVGDGKSVTIQTLNQRIIECMEICDIEVTFEERTTITSALVIPFLSYNVVLGMDFIRQRQWRLKLDAELDMKPAKEIVSLCAITEVIKEEMKPIPQPATTTEVSNNTLPAKESKSNLSQPEKATPCDVGINAPQAEKTTPNDVGNTKTSYLGSVFDGVVIYKTKNGRRARNFTKLSRGHRIKVTILNANQARLFYMGEEKIVQMK